MDQLGFTMWARSLRCEAMKVLLIVAIIVGVLFCLGRWANAQPLPSASPASNMSEPLPACDALITARPRVMSRANVASAGRRVGEAIASDDYAGAARILRTSLERTHGLREAFNFGVTASRVTDPEYRARAWEALTCFTQVCRPENGRLRQQEACRSGFAVATLRLAPLPAPARAPQPVPAPPVPTPAPVPPVLPTPAPPVITPAPSPAPIPPVAVAVRPAILRPVVTPHPRELIIPSRHRRSAVPGIILEAVGGALFTCGIAALGSYWIDVASLNAANNGANGGWDIGAENRASWTGSLGTVFLVTGAAAAVVGTVLLFTR